mmetsp:Transcript_21841/g.33823  ORF Transcript_21841/g.33823 Transcript_21841/m.33823 type:complete len:461 (+) Transcript_21841:361-1743(+)
MNLFLTLLKQILSSENGSMSLHSLLESKSDLGRGVLTVGESQLVVLSEGLLSGVGGKVGALFSGLELLLGGDGGSSSEDDQIQERVSSKSVGTVDGSASSLTASEKASDLLIIAVGILLEGLSLPVSRYTTHVVVDSGQDGDRLLGGVDTGEDMGGLDDTRESLHKSLRRQVVQVEMDMISLSTDSSSLKNLNSHRPRDDISGSKILSGGSVSFHEALSVLVSEDSTLSSAAFGHEAADSVDSGGMELHELRISNRKTGSGNHATSVTSASMSRGAREVSSTVATGGDDGLVGLHSVDSTIGHVEGHGSAANSVMHDKIHSEVFDEENAVISQGTAEQGVEHAVSSSVGHGAGSVSLSSLSELFGLSTEGTLVDLAFVVSRERHAVRLHLVDSGRSLLSHVLDGILVTEPVTALNSVIVVPLPVVSVHVSEGGVDTSLGSHGVGSGGEQLRNTGRFEAHL